MSEAGDIDADDVALRKISYETAKKLESDELTSEMLGGKFIFCMFLTLSDVRLRTQIRRIVWSRRPTVDICARIVFLLIIIH